ncbi:MAG: HAMP domain-containing histidine kinase [Flavobacteriaceae bacterium]|nr:HAMP domain-containing histidine kinase [Flavobacteriaceae bacterium]
MKEKEALNSELRKEIIVLKEQLKTATEELEHRQTKQAFIIGKTIHNLKNPVGISSSFAEMMLEDLEFYTPEKLKKHLTVIKSSCDFSITLLNNLQYISKLESGKSPLNLVEKNYCKLVKKAVKSQQLLANKKNITLELDVDCDSCKIQLDPVEITQVLHNIIHNAHRFSLEKSTIKITVTASDHFIITTVTDQGIGIAQKDLKDIFNEFKVIATFSSDGEKCLGLGLSIAKEIIEQHHGEITVSSTLNQGSTFTLKLPRN